MESISPNTIEQAIRDFLEGTSNQIKQSYPDLNRKTLLEKFKSIDKALSTPNEVPQTSLMNEQV